MHMRALVLECCWCSLLRDKCGSPLFEAVPYLMMLGCDDELIDLEAAQGFHQECSSLDKTLKQYNALKHSLWEEAPERVDEVCDDVLQWVSK